MQAPPNIWLSAPGSGETVDDDADKTGYAQDGLALEFKSPPGDDTKPDDHWSRKVMGQKGCCLLVEMSW
jgi:hypothetical protein